MVKLTGSNRDELLISGIDLLDGTSGGIDSNLVPYATACLRPRKRLLSRHLPAISVELSPTALKQAAKPGMLRLQQP